VYEGQFVAGKRQGQGILRYKTGEETAGEWTNGILTGPAIGGPAVVGPETVEGAGQAPAADN
jgi:hypothetical protein